MVNAEGLFSQATPYNPSTAVGSRQTRRQRRLDELSISGDKVILTDNVLGKGGFGTVVICNFYDRNAAAKILPISCNVDDFHDGDIYGEEEAKTKERSGKNWQGEFFRELETMIYLRSPHVVQVYGAITSRKDAFVVVMELLVGGDLRMFLKSVKEPLSDDRARQIIKDVCMAMTFLHKKRVIHGDLKLAMSYWTALEERRYA